MVVDSIVLFYYSVDLSLSPYGAPKHRQLSATISTPRNLIGCTTPSFQPRPIISQKIIQ